MPHGGAAVLEEAGAGVAADAGVDADGGAAGQAVVVEGSAVAGVVAQGPVAEVDALAGGSGAEAVLGNCNGASTQRWTVR